MGHLPANLLKNNQERLVSQKVSYNLLHSIVWMSKIESILWMLLWIQSAHRVTVCTAILSETRASQETLTAVFVISN